MKKILALILCVVMIASVALLTSCKNEEKNDPADDTAPVTKDDDTKDTETKDIGIDTIEPVDTSKIEPAKGGDIVGEWLSDALQLTDEENGNVLNYNTRFIFLEDGTLLYKISVTGKAEMTKTTYSVDGANLTVGEELYLPNATYTVDGDILLINSDTLNVAFRRQ